MRETLKLYCMHGSTLKMRCKKMLAPLVLSYRARSAKRPVWGRESETSNVH
jgi:hypothetical protein